MIGILVNGCKGNLGRAICGLVDGEAYKGVASVSAGVDSAEGGGERYSFPVFSDIEACDMPADVIVDCSHHRAALGVVSYAVAKKTPLLMCTTGLGDDALAALGRASSVIPVFRSPNMSLGVNLLANLAEKAARTLGDTYDVEIIEKHHNQKVDSPSGTALMLAERLKTARNGRLEAVYGRGGAGRAFGKRGRNELGIHAVRGGTIVGEHEIIFAGMDEIIEIKHTALSKNVFAEGVIRAALFLAGKAAGDYCMEDLM